MKALVCLSTSVRGRVYVRSPESNRVNQAKGYFTQTSSKGHEGRAIKTRLLLTLSSRSCNTDVTANLHSQFSPHSRRVRTALHSAINYKLNSAESVEKESSVAFRRQAGEVSGNQKRYPTIVFPGVTAL